MDRLKMPKKLKNRKKVSDSETRTLVLADDSGMQYYGYVEQALGSATFTTKCSDGITRRAKARSRRMFIKVGMVILVSLREFDDGNCDVIYKYSPCEVATLKKMVLIPKNFDNENEDNNTNQLSEQVEFAEFDFDQI